MLIVHKWFIIYISLKMNFSHLVLELMEENLEELLDRYTMCSAEVTRLCKDLVMGLQFLHEQKILHRDLKPQNILYKVHPKLCLKIADFGLSRTVDSKCTDSIWYGCWYEMLDCS